MFALLACSPPHEHLISIDRDALGSVRGTVVESDGETAIVRVDDSELAALGARMHDFHRCGGYMLHESLADAEAALHPLDEERIDYTLDRATVVHAVLPAVDRDKILSTIRELSAMQNRYYRSSTGAAASTWLQQRWQRFTDRRDVTVELVDHGYPQKSVVMTIPGTTRASEVVVIGGHLDSISPGMRSGNAPGADDDASGIATLTEVARALLAKGVRFERTIKFIAYAAEEVGLRGSLSIARDFKKHGVRVVGALQLDMTNYQGSDKDIWLISDFTSAAQNAFLGHLIDAYVGASWAYDKCGYACSDHASWHRFGVPASMPFEARFQNSNRNIHTAKDTLEISGNNADHAHKFALLAAAYAIELAKGDVTWLAAR